MKVLIPGHQFALSQLDGDGYELLTFVSRMGFKYPGNMISHSGTTTQEVIRALIYRLEYVDNQEPHIENMRAINFLRQTIIELESRAKKVRGEVLEITNLSLDVENIPTCSVCLHIQCTKHGGK